MQIIRRKAKQLWTRRQVKVALAMLLTLAVCSIMQLEEVRPTVVSRYSLPDGTSGKVSLDWFSLKTAATDHFVRLEFVSTWTEATRSKSHSTLLHVGETEATGIRLDLGQSDIPDVFSYFLVVGSGVDANGYRFEEFPLTESDLGDARMSLLISNQSYEFSVFTNSGRVFQSQGRSAPIDYRQIYLGGGPADLVPSFTDIRLYPSETVNSSIRVEHGEFRSTSRIGLTQSTLLLANWIFNVLLGIGAAWALLLVVTKRRLLSLALRRVVKADPSVLLVTVVLGLWVVVLPAWWVQAAYRDVPVTRNFSGPVLDGHCDPKIQGVGGHCFGDYYHTVNNLHRSFEPGVNNYPPPALLPHLVTSTIQDFFDLSLRAGLFLYLTACVVALMIPSIFVLRHKKDQYQLAAGFLLSVCSLPSLIALDRGNNVALIVPFLLAFCVYTKMLRFESAALALAFAAAIKPQFALAFVFFVGVRKWRALTLGLGLCAMVSVVGFALWPGNRIENVSVFISGLVSYGERILISSDYPPNLSASRGAYQFLSLLGISTPSVEHAGYILLAVALVTVIGRGKSIDETLLLTLSLLLPVLVPSVTFAYYLIVVVPLAAVILTFGANGTTVYDRAILLVTAVVTALSLVPLPISLSESGVFFSPHYSGMMWLMICLAVLLSAWFPKSKNSQNLTVTSFVD